MWPPAPGANVSKYRVERLIGAGGMGSVYLARDLDLDREVAIKFISAERAGDAVAQRRLIHEARAAAALDHPNICAVHDIIIESDGHACIVMQFVEGETLSSRLRRGPLEPRQALLMAADVASALAAAHKRGIVHRDIKPQNIMITPSGKAKLLDFGIARLEEASHAGARETTATRLTGPGHLAGTPTYMSPEQVQQLPLDGRSDLFALGAVLYECLTGRRPFDAPTDTEVYVQILHDHPPAVSTLRPQLTDREDELCRRLLAKHPDDRFGSAEELLGALRVLAPDTAHASGTNPRARSLSKLRISRRKLAFVAITILAAAGIWLWLRPAPLPEPPADAARWYLKGTQSIHDGAYHSGRLALQEAIGIYPEYALAYARLAEAHIELDDGDSAQKALLMVDKLIPNLSRLRPEDRLRLDAARALALQDSTAAVTAYKELAARRPADAGVWLDLGRVQEASASLVDARGSYERAIAVDRHYAAAHLRRATTLTQQINRDEAFREFEEAERLYRAASNVEGETEALLQRGAFLIASRKFSDARSVLERAQSLAVSLTSRAQELRAQLRLSNLTAAEGRFEHSLTMAGGAIDAALTIGLETVAADGLIELAITLMRLKLPDEADAQLVRAMQLAERAGAQRVLARAKLQRASLLIAFDTREKAEEALALARSSVEFMRQRGYRRYELTGLSILSRAHGQLGQFAEARTIAEDVLRVAEEVRDEAQITVALENLAAIARTTGAYPDALEFRLRREHIHRAQKNALELGFDLVNRAELLIHLGRQDEAERVLDEVAEGIAAGVAAYKPRERRVAVLRAFSATFTHRFEAAARAAESVVESSGGTLDGNGRMAAALLAHAEARLGRRRSSPGPSETGSRGEAFYWDLAARLASGHATGVLDAVTEELKAELASPSDEFEWRLAAMGAVAARRINADEQAQALSARAQHALQRLADAWKDHTRTYAARPDVVELIREARLKSPS
jgi:tetratricopeptide (TPR) repeat protein